MCTESLRLVLIRLIFTWLNQSELVCDQRDINHSTRNQFPRRELWQPKWVVSSKEGCPVTSLTWGKALTWALCRPMLVSLQLPFFPAGPCCAFTTRCWWALSHTAVNGISWSHSVPLTHLQLITSVTFINMAQSCQGSFPSHHPQHHVAAFLCHLDLGNSKPPHAVLDKSRIVTILHRELLSFHQVKHWLNL